METDKTTDSFCNGRTSTESSDSYKQPESTTNVASWRRQQHRKESGEPSLVEAVLAETLNQSMNSAEAKKEVTGSCGGMLNPATTSSTDSGSVGVMQIQVTKTPKTSKTPNWMYPYKELEEQGRTYRGYPIDGTKSLKKANWRIQIVSPACGPPTEALPQFPQQEILKRRGKVYVGCPGIELTEKEVLYNSGEAWLSSKEVGPQSQYFYTAGYHKGSAVKLQKKDPSSIYKSLVSGTPVPVKIVPERS